MSSAEREAMERVVELEHELDQARVNLIAIAERERHRARARERLHLVSREEIPAHRP